MKLTIAGAPPASDRAERPSYRHQCQIRQKMEVVGLAFTISVASGRFGCPICARAPSVIALGLPLGVTTTP